MPEHSYPLDPHEILGVAPGTALGAIREAYREKAKKYHPDVGGDAWAFRIVSWAYQTLGTARVVGRAQEEMTRPAASPTPPPREPTAAAAGPRIRPPDAQAPPDGRVRPGYRDKGADPARTIDVELLLIRFEVADPMELIFVPRPEDRNLSCSLNVSWPARGAPALPPAAATQVLHSLSEAFDVATSQGRPVSARSNTDGGRFSGWLSFPTVARAEAAFLALHGALKPRDLFVAESIREIFVPRDWR